MGKIREKKKLIKIVAATSVAIFSLFSVCTGVFAWFTAIKDVKNDNEVFSVVNVEKLQKISYHQFVGTPTDNNCSFNKTPVASITYNQETKSFDKPKNVQSGALSVDMEKEIVSDVNLFINNITSTFGKSIAIFFFKFGHFS